jgi:hypothetical protein
MKILKYVLPVGFIALSLQGCQKEEEVIYTDISNFYKDNGVPVQELTINASQSSGIYTSRYTMISADSGAFVNSNNQVVTGPVVLKVRELLTKKDMILSGVFSVSNGKPLVSAGEYYIEATQNGEQLQLAYHDALRIYMPVYDPAPYSFYEFYAEDPGSSSGWGDTQDTVPVFVTTGGGVGPGLYYDFGVNSLGWINCDHFVNSSDPMTKVRAQVNGSLFTTENTKCFIVFNDLNSAAEMWLEPPYYTPGMMYELPLGLDVTFVAISIVNGKYYSAFQSTSITDGHTEQLSLTPTTLADIKAQLANL